MKDFYRILDLPRDASPQQIKDRYRQLVRIFHPDRYPKPEDKAYAEQKLQEINEAYEALHGDGSRGLRLSSDRRPPLPVIYPEQVDLGSVVHGERAHAQLRIDNVGGFAQALNFHIEDGVDWFAITKGERVDPAKPLPMLLYIEARTASLPAGQVVENWLDIELNGVRARATIRMAVVNRSSMAPRPSRSVSFATALVVLLIAVYAAWTMQGATSPESTTSTPLRRSVEATLESDDGFSAAILPTTVSTVEKPAIEAETAPPATEALPATEVPPLDGQGPESQVSQSGVLQPVDPVPTAEDAPTIEPSVDESLVQLVEAAGAELLTMVLTAAISTPEIQSDTERENGASLISKAAASQLANGVVAKEATATSVPPMSVSPTSVPSTPTPFPPQGPSPILPAASVATASPAPTEPSVTITVPRTYQINVRISTTIESESLALLDKGATFPAIARTIDSAWTQIILPDGRTGWVFTTSMVANLEQIGTLPVSTELLNAAPSRNP